MKEVRYEFVELESDHSFQQLGKAFGGTCRFHTLVFDNALVQGEIVSKQPEEGLWVRKWKLTVFEKVTLHRLPAPSSHPKKYNLLFFINPTIFDLKNDCRKLHINSQKNTVFISNDTAMDFSVLPKQPFYVLDVTFNSDRLARWMDTMDETLKTQLELRLSQQQKTMIMKPCQLEEYKLLYKLDTLLKANNEDQALNASSVYQLIFCFLKNICVQNNLQQKQRCFHYEQVIEVATMIDNDLKNTPRIAHIAQMVNMSSSSLLRHFKQVYGKSIQDYYVQMKMELAKQLIQEKNYSVKKAAEMLGYKQASAFIETFTKQFGYSHGSCKVQCVY